MHLRDQLENLYKLKVAWKAKPTLERWEKLLDYAKICGMRLELPERIWLPMVLGSGWQQGQKLAESMKAARERPEEGKRRYLRISVDIEAGWTTLRVRPAVHRALKAGAAAAGLSVSAYLAEIAGLMHGDD